MGLVPLCERIKVSNLLFDLGLKVSYNHGKKGERYMSNDLTLTDIKTVVDEAMKSEVANLKRQILETTSNDEWTKNINYKAVCQHMDYAIFEFVTESTNPEVKAFGQKLMSELAQKFGITERI